MSIFDEPFRILAKDEFSEQTVDITSEVDSASKVSFSLNREDFCGVLADPSGLSSANFGFADRLKQRFVNGNISTNPVTLIFQKQNSGYENIFLAKIDDNETIINETKVGISIKGDSLLHKIKDNKETVYSVTLDSVLKDEMRIDYNYVNMFGTGATKYARTDCYGCGVIPLALAGTPYGGGLNIGEPDADDKHAIYNNVGGIAAVDPVLRKTTLNKAEIQINIEAGLYVDITYARNSMHLAGLRLELVELNETAHARKHTRLANSVRTRDINIDTVRYFFEGISSVIPIESGYLSYYQLNYRPIESDYPIEVEGAMAASHYQLDNAKIKIYAALTDTGLRKGTRCVTLFSALAQCLTQLANANLSVDIDLLKLKAEYAFNCVLANPMNFKTDAVLTDKIKVTITDLIAHIDNVFCIGVEEQEGNTLLIADRDKIRKRRDANAIDNFAKLQIQVDKDTLIKTIKAGCNKGVSSDSNGKVDIHGELSYQFAGLGESGKEYNIAMGYYTNPSGIEYYLKTNSIDTTQANDVKDDSIFMYAVSAYQPLAGANFKLYKVAGDKMKNMPISMYNLPISPMRCLLRHANYLVTLLASYRDTRYYTLAKTQNVSYITSSSILPFESNEVFENIDVLPINSAKAFFTKMKASFTTDIYFADKLKYANRNTPLLIKTDLLPPKTPTGVLAASPVFLTNEQEMIISPNGIDYAFCENDKSEVTGSIATTEQEERGTFYLTNYCKEDIF